MDLPVTSRIVFSLMDPLLAKGYCLYSDNFYMSPTLADKLVDCETDTVVRVTRKDVIKDQRHQTEKRRNSSSIP